MTQPHNIMIHEFITSALPQYFDAEGDQMFGFYYQFTNEQDEPVSDLIGPYRRNGEAEHAALRAFKKHDF